MANGYGTSRTMGSRRATANRGRRASRPTRNPNGARNGATRTTMNQRVATTARRNGTVANSRTAGSPIMNRSRAMGPSIRNNATLEQRQAASNNIGGGNVKGKTPYGGVNIITKKKPDGSGAMDYYSCPPGHRGSVNRDCAKITDKRLTGMRHPSATPTSAGRGRSANGNGTMRSRSRRTSRRRSY
tara:strand:- start:570 stop:1127 length:558 start_codon:yes stop_codon:yes gene_type:complete